MQCPSCGKTGFVSVNTKRYCSNCGTQLVGAHPAALSDIRQQSVAPEPLRLSEIKPQAAPAIRAAAKPVSGLHSRQAGTLPKVLDLRAKASAAASVTAPQASPIKPIVKIAPTRSSDQKAPGTSFPPAQPVIMPTATPPAAYPVQPPTPAHLAAALPTSRSSTQPQTTKPPPTITVPQNQAARMERVQGIAKHNLVQKFVKPQSSTEGTTAKQTAPGLPNSAAAQVESMKRLMSAPGHPTGTARPDELHQAVAAARTRYNPAGALAAVASIAIMGGYIWLSNAPKLAFHSAASKAGFEASMPTYIPSSYRQSGPVAYKTGEISLNFSSPSISEPLKITQRTTSWDSNSLRENYVSKQTTNYLAVQGQGLTIFLFNNDQASWTNHGIWYNITGTTHLSRDQILKIAYSL